MTVYKRGDRWLAQVNNPDTNRPMHLGTFDTKREALAAEAKAYEHRITKTETVASFAKRWAQDFPRPKASTNIHNSERVSKFAQTYGRKRLDQITRQQARAWALEHPAEHSALRVMFSDALRDDLINSNPFANLGINRKQPKRHLEPGWMTEQDIHDLAAAAYLVHQPGTADIVSNAILVSAYTGIRAGEMFALEIGDVMVNELSVSKAVTKDIDENGKTKWVVGLPKSGRTNIIALPRIAREAIENTPRLHPARIFNSPTGRMLYQSSWHGLWNPVRVAAGKPRLQYHELRHWCATNLLDQGLTPSDVAMQLTHSDGGVLVQTIYGHPSEINARQRILDTLNNPQHVHNTNRRKAQ